MNKMIEIMKDHSSHRKFDVNYELPEQDLQLIIECAKQASTYINGQFYSIIIVKDKEKRAQMVNSNPLNSHILNSSVFLLFIMDLNRSNKIFQHHHTSHDFSDNIDHLFLGSVDTALSCANAINAVESLGLGCVVVGGVRYHVDEIIDLFKLPTLTYPLFGLSIGKPIDTPVIKPRLSNDTMIFTDEYKDYSYDLISDYDLILSKNQLSESWSDSIKNYFNNDSLKEITRKGLDKQKLL
ncbi:nitroreductase family protein [Enterococcus quebecensis]|uniref:Nitroreductase domain-containing protein n=1 Tax=Enterococcus quebecensis TaxID=903983 RepID=A0A1E5GQF2_9ENTE|nr:nitroreductase family protein [Enterococcus quebecensis]OEG14923.1 hypothetical protein BCR23_11085 [Enterococcus quebecensis]